MANKIERNYFLFWTGQDFQYVNYLCVLSLVKSNAVKKCEIYYDEEPVHNCNWEKLRALDNVRLIRFNFENMVELAQLNKEDFRAFLSKALPNEKSDFFRYLVLYCYGGIYFDFDCLVIRDLDPLLNCDFFLGVEEYSRNDLNGAVLGSVKRNPLLAAALKKTSYIFQHSETPRGWGCVGPTLLTDMLYPKTLLGKAVMKIFYYHDRLKSNILLNNVWIAKLLNMVNRNKWCRSQIYPKSFFYFYSYQEWQKIFHPDKLRLNIFLIHLWGKFSHDFTRDMDETYFKNSKSVYAFFAKTYIP
jgi:hypothetical protein